jgi:Uma2 family endonuclease
MSKANISKAEMGSHQLDRTHIPEDALHGLIPATSIRHQLVSLRIAAALLLYAESGSLGQVLQAPCNVMLSREFIIQPDIFFVARGRTGLIEKASLRGAPDVTVEVLSPKTREKDLKIKRKIYSRFEVKEYWTVDPETESIEVLLWSELGYASNGIYGRSDQLSSPALPKLSLPLRKVFAHS